MPSTNCKITILTGKIHCGKSRALGRFLSEMKDQNKKVRGVLNPSIDQEKWFVNLENEDIFSAEKMAESDTPLKVGKYTFSTDAFEKAKDIVSENSDEPCDFFVIDELGKLELENKGLEPAISMFLEKLPQRQISNLIIVVRDTLVAEATKQFQIKSPAVITQTELFRTEWH